MNILDLTRGIGDFNEYKLFKFPGGELHFILKKGLTSPLLRINTRLNSSDDIIALCIVVDTLKKDDKDLKITVYIPYIPYQQADRNFGEGECFSLKTIINILNSLDVYEYIVFDPHSEVSSALMKNCTIIDNSKFVNDAIVDISAMDWAKSNDLIFLSPDAGAYKKIFKLADKIGFKGEILCANKYRDHEGKITTQVPVIENLNKNILIIDDIALGGRTFIQIVEKIKAEQDFKGKFYLAISHGIFNHGYDELTKHFDKIFSTNSRKNDYPKFISVFNVI